MRRIITKPAFHIIKSKMQISCSVTALLINAIVFAMKIVKFLFFLNSKLQASSHILSIYSSVCVLPGRKP